MPYAASSGESTCSNRVEASVRSFNAWAVLRTDTPSKLADSITIFFVDSSIAAGMPPFTPAMPTGASPAVITSIESLSVYFFLSSASITSPSFANRTPRGWGSPAFPLSGEAGLPQSLWASNACSGAPRLNITKLVASTTLLMERWPTASSLALSHSGDGPTVTPLIYPAMYRLQRTVLCISTVISVVLGSKSDLLENGSLARGIFKIADSSLAMPRWLRQSCPRFGVTLPSNTSSLGESDSPTFSTPSISNAWKVSASAKASAFGNALSKNLSSQSLLTFMLLKLIDEPQVGGVHVSDV